MSEITQDWTCSRCGADLNKSVAILGKDAYWYHQFIHDAEDKELEIQRLRKGIKELRDGGYGCREEAKQSSLLTITERAGAVLLPRALLKLTGVANTCPKLI